MRTDVLGLARSITERSFFIAVHQFIAINILFYDRSNQTSDNDVSRQIYCACNLFKTSTTRKSSTGELVPDRKSELQDTLFRSKSWQTRLFFDAGDVIPAIWRWHL
ncbi:MAG: hypothetical protein ACTSP4_06855 [Candidatus Hodarchaeales archaeon]